MILQELLINNKTDDVDELFIRGEGIEFEDSGILIPATTTFSTDTYFNSFSLGKWCTYGNIDNVSLNIRIKGDFQIKIWVSTFRGKNVHSELMAVDSFHFEEEAGYTYHIPKRTDGVVWYEIKALGECVYIYGAEYVADCVANENIKLALNICTFKREQYLLRNIDLLKNGILCNSSSELYGKVHIFISDNAGTIQKDEISHPLIHLFHNDNSGGSGGFTRGLTEIIKTQEEEKFSYIIFMDDDIEIEAETLLRTYRLLCVLKDEYKDYFLAGAMLRLDNPMIQHENGALWNGGRCHFINRGFDLSDFSKVVKNENEQRRDYAAWWYCCVNMDIIREDNLPLPLFIHQDDVEYSLRNAKGIISMNGISVWHEVKGKSHVVSPMRYYNLRNKMIVNRMYGYKAGLALGYLEFAYGIVTGIIRGKKSKVRLLSLAMKDFRNGIIFQKDYDSAAKHEDLLRICGM